jgi:AraC-like DNA-binding protein
VTEPPAGAPGVAWVGGSAVVDGLDLGHLPCQFRSFFWVAAEPRDRSFSSDISSSHVMQRAAHFMDAGNLPLKTIIAVSGYASEAAFRKAFHQWIGMLPSQYKEGVQRPGEKKTKLES